MDFTFIADIPAPWPPPPGTLWASPAVVFALTVALEWPMLAWWSRLGFRRTALFAVVVNGLTWGTAMGVLALWPVPVPLVETAIVLVEAALLVLWWQWPWRKALPVSLGMNVASWVLGTALLTFFMHHA